MLHHEMILFHFFAENFSQLMVKRSQ